MKTSTIIKPQKGAAAVELAVVISILVLLAVGVCEFGILFYNKQVLVNASREGARAGTTRADDCGIATSAWLHLVVMWNPCSVYRMAHLQARVFRRIFRLG